MTYERKHDIILCVQGHSTAGFPKLWTIIGYVLLWGTALFVGRIVYEETVLTWVHGPQMVGFAMMHGAVPFVPVAGLIGIPGSVLWIVVSLILLFTRKFRISLADWIPMIGLVILAVLLFIPYERWEELVLRLAGPGSHGNEFMVQAAAHGDKRLLEQLLRNGYDINYEDRGGTTPLSAAAVEGNREILDYLVSKGADVNRKNRLSAQTPLMAAAEMGQRESVNRLLDSGADACATDTEGHNAAGLATRYRHSDIAEYLSSRFSCPEKIINPCADPSVSICVQ